MFLIFYIIINKLRSIIKRVKLMEILYVIISAVNFVMLAFLLMQNRKKHPQKPIILMENSKLNNNEMEESGIGIEELVSYARAAGWFNIGDIDTAILETSGEISFLPKPMRRRLNPKDFNFAPEREGICRIIISHGEINKENLRASGIDEDAVNKLLEQRGSTLADILFATANEAGRVDFFEKS